ncbi:MAG: 23S rRNA (pseudouridine(1915)-N(3))-methyltransferase RlmH [Deferribacteraceae bacterium]|jgi:23S rRNA (pseudouridine1915-N3)-methyltransferase|nr:23S rRNA (pseudouridine(1915)-N(3))-methyltransferase RlmH [Deferribacteraceae bacterium]
MKVQVILEGKLRKSRALEWIGEYQKRLSGSMPLEIVEWGAPQAAREERFFNSIKAGDRLVALDAGGKIFDTLELADYFKELTEQCRTLYIFVGEAEGHSETVLKHVKERWSLSRLTMSYEVALVVIAEQLYRNMTIRTGHPYHK